MKDFLITSSICLFTFLAVYHLLLEREKIHRFNRFYLLFSILISFVIPFINFEIIKEIPPETAMLRVSNPVVGTAVQEETADYLPFILFGIYALVTVIFAVRFVKNIILMRRKMHSGASIRYQNAKLVLLAGETLPHTFLSTIFISKKDYENRNIEDELYKHELTHVVQKHTLDVLFIETLKTVFWFNPMLFFYKKAIQLNHEFLADQTVAESCPDIHSYQRLLLSKAKQQHTYALASNLNYSITKKRMIMMTKTTSKLKSTCCKLSLIPLLTAVVLLLCVEISAQTKPALVAENLSEKPTDKARDQYYAGVWVLAKNTDGKVLANKKYEQLTTEEKERFLFYVPKKLEKMSLTSDQFEGLKNTKKYAVWIDGQHVASARLNQYKAADFSHLSTSFVYKNARSKKFPQPYQSSLYTNGYYEKSIKNKNHKFSGDTIEIVVGDYNKPLAKNPSEKDWAKADKILKSKTKPDANGKIAKNNADFQDDTVYNAVEVQPEFPGGMAAFYKYIAENFKMPADFKGQGKIISQFIIEKDGTLSRIKVLRDVGFGTDKEAERVLLGSPKWKPGVQNGKTVRVLYSLPITINGK